MLRIAVSSEDDRLQQQILRSYDQTRTVVHAAVERTPTDSTRSRVDAVLDGSADVAFVRLGAAPSPLLRHHRLSTGPMLLAVPTAHPLASTPVGDALTPDRLDQQPLAFYHRDQNPWWYDEVIGLLADHGAHPRITHRGLWAYDVLTEVNAGRAVALVGTENAADIALPHVTYRRLDPAPRVHVGLLWNAEADAAVDDFVHHAATLTAR